MQRVSILLRQLIEAPPAGEGGGDRIFFDPPAIDELIKVFTGLARPVEAGGVKAPVRAGHLRGRNDCRRERQREQRKREIS
jgi:hypothetical protein